MTFTYTPSDTPSDLTRVRFYTEDTQSPGLLSDEEISMLIAENDGEWEKALVPVVSAIMGKLARESGVRMDWLQIDRGEALKYYAQLKGELANRFQANTRRKSIARAVSVTRTDVP